MERLREMKTVILLESELDQINILGIWAIGCFSFASAILVFAITLLILKENINLTSTLLIPVVLFYLFGGWALSSKNEILKRARRESKQPVKEPKETKHKTKHDGNVYFLKS